MNVRMEGTTRMRMHNRCLGRDAGFGNAEAGILRVLQGRESGIVKCKGLRDTEENIRILTLI